MFFALPEFTTSDGKPVNATFGMAKFFTGQLIKESPDYIVFIKDAKGKNFRHEIYSEYKATREKMPDTLRSQIADIEKMIGLMNIHIIEIPWYEADDVIATLAKKLSKETHDEICILSWDKDLYALVDEQVKIYDTQRKKISGIEETQNKFWVPPSAITDYLAICGDTSDNIPWIAGIGPKKAQVLLHELKNLENIYTAIEDEDTFASLSDASKKILTWKSLEKFQKGKENAFLSQKLATLDSQIPFDDFILDEYEFHHHEIENTSVQNFFKDLEFFSLIQTPEVPKETWKDIDNSVNIVWDSVGMQELKKHIFASQKIVLDTETTSLNIQESELVGISILVNESIYYINIGHSWPKVGHEEVKDFIKELQESDILIIWHNLKYDLQILTHFLSQQQHSDTKAQEQIDWQMQLWI